MLLEKEEMKCLLYTGRKFSNTGSSTVKKKFQGEPVNYFHWTAERYNSPSENHLLKNRFSGIFKNINHRLNH